MQSCLLAQQLEFLTLELDESKAREHNLQLFNDKLLGLLTELSPNLGTDIPFPENSRGLQDAKLEDLELELSRGRLDLEALRNTKDAEITKLNDKIIQLESVNRNLKVDIESLRKNFAGRQKQTEGRYETDLKRAFEIVETERLKFNCEKEKIIAEWKGKMSAKEKLHASEMEIMKLQIESLQNSAHRQLSERKHKLHEKLETSFHGCLSELGTASSRRSPLNCMTSSRNTGIKNETEELYGTLKSRYTESVEARDQLISQLKHANKTLQKQVYSLKSDLVAVNPSGLTQSERERLLTEEVKQLIGKLMKAKNKLKAEGKAGELMRKEGFLQSLMSESLLKNQAESFAKSFERSFF